MQIVKTFDRKIVDIFISISFNISFGCSKEPSWRDSSFEYPQHMFWLRNKKNNFKLLYKPLFIYSIQYKLPYSLLDIVLSTSFKNYFENSVDPDNLASDEAS